MNTTTGKNQYISPAIEVIELESDEAMMMQHSITGSSMDDVDMDGNKSSWAGIDWD